MGDLQKPPQHRVSAQIAESLVAPKKPSRNKYAFACTTLASMTSILLGYDIGVMSGAVLFIKDDFKITDVHVEILMGMSTICSLLGSTMAGKVSDWMGRRYTIVLVSAIFFVAALLMGFATNYAFLMVGRLVAGIAVGFALSIAPVYTAEVSPASSRGFLSSFPEIFINIGMLLGYLSNFAFAKFSISLGWRLVLGIGAIPSIFMAMGILAMPESPRWLVMQGRLGEAKRVLDKTSDSQQESESRLADIKSAAGIPDHCKDDIVVVPKHHHEKSVWRELILHPTPTVRHILIAGLGIQFFQQTCGIEVVVLYSPRIFKQAGLSTTNNLLLATIVLGFVKTCFVLVATFLLDRVGRRPLLLTSVAGMIISLGGLGFGLTVILCSDTILKWAIVLCLGAVLSYVAFFSIGVGPITWVYSSEIFPLRLRAQGYSMAVAMNRVTSTVICMTFLSLSKAITIGGVFFLFMGFAVIAWVFFYTMLPETQGVVLEDISSLFGGFRHNKRSINRVVNSENEA